MKKILVTCSFAIQILLAQAPGFNWAAGDNGVGGNDFGLAIATDVQGNIYSTGAFKFQVDFDPGPGTNAPISAGVNDLYIQKLSPAGNLIWLYHIGNTGEEIGRAIAIDASGNILVTGNFTSTTTDFDEGAGVSNLSCNGNSDAFVLKLSAAGTFIWAKSIGDINEEMGYSICSDASSNVLIGGHFNTTVDFDPGPGTSSMTASAGYSDGFVLKLDMNGNYVFAKQFEGPYHSTVFGVKCNTLGQIGITGSFQGDIDLDPSAATNIQNSPNISGFFTLLDNNGNYLHGHVNNGAPYYAIQFDPNNHILLTGYAIGYVDLDPGPGVTFTSPNLNNDAFVVRFRPNGSFVWGKSIAANGYENGFAVDVDGSGNVITVGNFSGTIDFDPGPGTVSVAGNGNYDIYIHKLDTAGNYVWYKQIGSSGDDQPKGISVDPFGNIAVTGYYNGTVDFDPGVGTTSLTSAGGGDIFVVRFQCLSTSSNVNITSCNHYTSPSGRYTWTTDGIYQDTITNVGGCDSIIHINLTIPLSSASSIVDSACRSYVSPSGNYTWTNSGNYTDTIPNYVGCDSIISVSLTVTSIDTGITEVNGTFLSAQAGAIYQWIDCNTQLNISGEITEFYTPSSNGSYGVIIHLNGCTDTTNCLTINNVGIDDMETLEVNIYPNPAIDKVQVNSSEIIDEWFIQDITGKTMLNSKIGSTIFTIDFAHLSPGIYLLQFISNHSILTRRIIKN